VNNIDTRIRAFMKLGLEFTLSLSKRLPDLTILLSRLMKEEVSETTGADQRFNGW